MDAGEFAVTATPIMRCLVGQVVLLLIASPLLPAAEVVAWGDNAHGQTNVPAEPTDVVAVAAGDVCSVAPRSDGHVVAWGSHY